MYLVGFKSTLEYFIRPTFRYIKKADVFSLGMTLFEAGGGGALPKNGQEWHEIRNNKLSKLERYSSDLNNLISDMVQSDPAKRLSSKELVEHPILCPTEEQSVALLRKELQRERLKNEILLKKLEEATRYTANSSDTTRVSGRTKHSKFIRSKSFNEFPSFPLT